jgi:hypothetical protein
MTPLSIQNVEESMSDRQGYKWRDFISLALFAAFSGAAFLIASDAASAVTSKVYLCTNNGSQRRIELRYEGVGELPCSVWYYRDSDPGQEVWYYRDSDPGQKDFRSNNNIGFCDGKVLNFKQNFERVGYQCKIMPPDTSSLKTMCRIQYPAAWQVSLDIVAGKFYFFPDAGDYLAKFNFLVEVTPYSRTVDHENGGRANPDSRSNQNLGEADAVRVRVLDVFGDNMKGSSYSERVLPIMPEQPDNTLIASLDISGENLNSNADRRENEVRYVCKADKALERARFARMCQTVIEATTLTDHHNKAGLCEGQTDQR